MFRELRLGFPLLGVLIAVTCAAGGTAGGSPSLTSPCVQAVEFDSDEFPRRPKIDNKWLPLIPGTRLTLEGRADRGGGPLPHTVTFTVTDLTKVIDGVRTRVVWDVDVNEGELAEAELAFFAQDDDDNVWNLGEYPEEFEDGNFAGAPNTWIAGIAGAQAGIHMLEHPRVGRSYLQGFAPEIEFLDCATVMSRNEQLCVPVACYDPLLLTHETSPLDPAGGLQTKYHAAGVGIVQIGALNDPEGETLVLSKLERLGPEALALARAEALALDARGYAVSDVYAQTAPAKPRPKTPPPAVVDSQPGTTYAPPGGSGLPAAIQPAPPGPAPAAAAGAPEFTPKVSHPLVPLTSVRYTEFKGREDGSDTRVVSRVLDKTTLVAGVRVAIVEVRDFEDGELVERTRDYYAQDQKGRVWYFGERVDDIENGKVVGHEGQWLAGKGNAKRGLFMPAKPKVGQVFEQERAPGVAEDRSRVVAVGLEVTTGAGRFDGCIKARDYAPLDKKTEFKFYCPGVGLVREKARNARLDLVRYR
jgi:hypothetical protein